MANPRVAILGLGIMGSGMAGRVLAANYPLTVYNRNPEKAKRFADAGAFVASSPREAAARAEIVISMVADDTSSCAIWLGPEGALAGANRDAVLIESSTLTVGWIKELAVKAMQRGHELLDAPVTGTKPHAESGELVFLVGGSEKALAVARPVLSVMSRDILHLGPTGSGAVMKLINNFLAGVQAASFAEAVAFIKASGLNRDTAISVLTNGAPGSPLVKTIAARANAGDFTPNFTLRLMAKDVGYALEEGNRHGVQLQTAASALEVLKRAVALGYGEKDFSAVIEATSENNR
ncbi:MAG: NAD(P)-dependent oxidoreductase [Terriglobales bacterium]|jgi:3-hydroxyisobutyrate dehydrogenase|nr:NAD(P)-dependent oxidoreductase [Terriglobales bacterium]